MHSPLLRTAMCPSQRLGWHREDVETGQEAGLDEAGQRRLWRELASGAESGWDFSSRWLADGEDG